MKVTSYHGLVYYFLFILLFSQSRCQLVSSDDHIIEELVQIKIDISQEEWTLIKRKRAEAMALGLLISSSDDFVDARIQIDSNLHAAKIRLKGDWLDHLKGDKWSWRVKLSEGSSILGLQQFSLQHPRTRSYLQEWVFHQLLQQEKILTPKYTFVQLWLNGDNKGIYALEEHFIETLAERQQKTAAPILKFSEDGFWQTQSYRLQYGQNVTPNLPDYEAADILPFQKGKIKKDSILYRHFQAAQSLLSQFRLQPEDAPNELIDPDQWARFFALCDVFEAYHALRWHNMRFYYNPTTARLEPIGYDAYGEKGVYRWFKKPFLGYSSTERYKVFFQEEFLIFGLFNNDSFRASYYKYLEHYSQANFVEAFFEQIGTQLQLLQQVMQFEFKDYNYSSKWVTDAAQHLRDTINSSLKLYQPFVYTIYDPMYEGCKTPMPLAAISLKAYPASGSKQLALQNYYCQAVSIQATGPKRNKPLHILEEPVVLQPFDIHQLPPVETTLTYPLDDRYVFYSVPGIDYWYRQKISNWDTPESVRFLDPNKLQIDTNIFSQTGHTIKLVQQQASIDRIQLIPANYQLVIAPGSQLDLRAGAAIFAYGKVDIQGTERHPVIIESSDKQGRGIHILGADQPVTLKYVNFSGLNTFHDNGRFYNGAVSVYDRTVSIDHCHFENSQAEDALNVVRSKANLSHLTFTNCRGDGLDADFSSGQIRNSYFSDIAGDGLDFSGSNFELFNLKFHNITDKGISAGEGTLLSGAQIEGSGMKIGLAAKDNAYVELSQLSFEYCDYGLVVFRKKSIYPEASLLVNDYQSKESNNSPWAIEQGHALSVDGNIIAPTHPPDSLKLIFYPLE